MVLTSERLVSAMAKHLASGARGLLLGTKKPPAENWGLRVVVGFLLLRGVLLALVILGAHRPPESKHGDARRKEREGPEKPDRCV